MNAEQLEKIQQIHRKPLWARSRSDWSKVYWFHYNEVEYPTEYQLLYCARYYGHMCRLQWWELLLKNFPSESNYAEMVKRFAMTNESCMSQRQAICRVIRRLLLHPPVSQEHIDLAKKYGSKKTRSMAERTDIVDLGHYEI